MGGKVYTKSVSIGGIDIKASSTVPTGVLPGSLGSVCISDDPAEPGIYQNLDGATDWDLLVPRTRLMMGIVKENLVNAGEDADDVEAGLYATVFPDFASLPATPATNPAYAVVWPLGQEAWQVAWYVHGVWQLTSFPWRRPGIPLPPGALPVVNLKSSNGAGGSNWQYAMGSVFKGQAGSAGRNIIGFAFKLGAGSAGTAHAVAIRYGGNSASWPGQAAFTTVSWSDVLTVSVDNEWVFEELPAPIPFGPDDWFNAQVWIGQGGQNFNINTLRTAGELNEDFLQLDRSTYVVASGTNPGTTPVPTFATPQNGIAYGVTALVTDGGPS